MESEIPVKNMSPEKESLTDLSDAGSPHGDPESNPQKDKDLWFDDGSIVVISGNTAFCVHRSVLSMNSPIFKDMFTLNGHHNDLSAGPATVHLPDAESDVRHFLKALYNRSYFTVGTPTHYDTLEALLRLGTKYQVSHLRCDVIKHLEMVYASNFVKFDAHDDLFIETPTTHGFRAVLMARENFVTSILPTALYYCCERSTTEIALGIEDESGRLLKLSNEDIRTCLLARDKLLDDKATVTIRKKLCKPPHPSCRRPACDPSIAYKNCWPTDSDFLSKCDLFTGTWNMPLPKNCLCPACEQQWNKTIRTYYQELWDKMPEYYFGMPPWASLRENTE